MKPKKLLAVFAHPDDESFGIGGTLALYSRRDVEVSLICATRGEAGNFPEDFRKNGDDIGRLREGELRCAAEVLGLNRVEFLDYRDSGMLGSPDNDQPGTLIHAPVEEVAAKITHIIRAIRPDVVVTFDPQGGYRHPDHIAIHHATVEAYHAAGHADRFPDEQTPYTPKKLYFATFLNRWLKLLVRLLPLFGQNPRKWGRNEDIDLVKITEISYPIHARIDIGTVVELKQKASACHASQLDGSPGQNPFARLVSRIGQNKETFMRAFPPASPRLRENDLFEGI
jgi:LmbE family N-acetylglucosaminyl deacetylase